MAAKHYGPYVRRISQSVGNEPSLIVQRLNPSNNEWVTHQIFGEMSDDYAYTNADRVASSLASRIGPDGLGEPY